MAMNLPVPRLLFQDDPPIGMKTSEMVILI